MGFRERSGGLGGGEPLPAVRGRRGLEGTGTSGTTRFSIAPWIWPAARFASDIKARGQGSGAWSVFWTTSDSPRGEDKAVHFPLNHDNEWHEYEASFAVEGRLTDVRLDPGSDVGSFDIDWIELIHEELHPLTIDRAETLAERGHGSM